MEIFEQLVKDFEPLIIFAKNSILDFGLDSEFASTNHIYCLCEFNIVSNLLCLLQVVLGLKSAIFTNLSLAAIHSC